MTAPLVNMLKAFGFDFEPEVIIQMVQDMARDVAEMRASQQRTEEMVRELWSKQNDGQPKYDIADSRTLIEHGGDT